MVGWFMLSMKDELMVDLCTTKRVQFGVLAFLKFFKIRFGGWACDLDGWAYKLEEQ